MIQGAPLWDSWRSLSSLRSVWCCGLQAKFQRETWYQWYYANLLWLTCKWSVQTDITDARSWQASPQASRQASPKAWKQSGSKVEAKWKQNPARAYDAKTKAFMALCRMVVFASLGLAYFFSHWLSKKNFADPNRLSGQRLQWHPGQRWPQTLMFNPSACCSRPTWVVYTLTNPL